MDEQRRIVNLGKTGSGKSSLANTIFGEPLFHVNHTPQSGTKECRAGTKSVNGRNITLIDTPGFFDTNMSEEDLKPAIIKCITECAPGPHAFLILLKLERYTVHEQAVITKVKEYFSEEALKYATVVFTHGDDLQEEQTVEKFVLRDENLSELVGKCSGRCHVIDNKYWKDKPTNEYRSNTFQVEQLLKTIDKMIEDNNDGYYSNEMLQAVEEELHQERESIRQSAENMSEEEINETAKKNIFDKLLIALTGIGTGVLIGAFFGIKIMIKLVLKAIKEAFKIGKEIVTLIKEGNAVGAVKAVGAVRAVRAVGAVGVATVATVAVCVGASALVGACAGGYEGFKAAEKAETAREAKEMAKKAVTEKGTRICDKIDNWERNSKQKEN